MLGDRQDRFRTVNVDFTPNNKIIGTIIVESNMRLFNFVSSLLAVDVTA